MAQKVAELHRLQEDIKLGGGKEKIEKQHQTPGRLTARERMGSFFDPGTFVEMDMFARPLGREFGMDKVQAPADGVIIGYGKVNGRQAAAFAQDYTVITGTMGEMHGKKIAKITEMAGQWGIPIVGFHESAGARLQEFLAVSREYGNLFYLNSIYSGVVPQISGMLGVVAGGQTYSPGLTDFIFMTQDGAAFIAGPPLVESVIGEKISVEDLGGARMHASTSGVCHVVARDDQAAVDQMKELLGYLPQNCREKPPRLAGNDDPRRTSQHLLHVVGGGPRAPYDMHQVIKEIVDNGKFFEIHKDFAKSMVVGFGRLDGYSVGFIANNPLHMAGAITTKAAEKAARFIRFCDAFNIPIVYFVASPAYLVGSQQEKEGMIYRGASLLYATSEATVPKITLIIGKAFAGAYIAMGSKYLRSDVVYAWPSAEIGLVAAEGTVNVIYRKEIAAAANPEEERKKREEQFRNTYMSVYYPASYQHIDNIIDPAQTRPVLIQTLEALQNKKQELPWRKHGNMPL
ncbi:MAG: acyl-CoA carboxylase subunit beta [Chloroflexi bacterium]|nr:acyl-CoA carboxylase subunit beta [Chloroflexota bacterium]